MCPARGTRVIPGPAGGAGMATSAAPCRRRQRIAGGGEGRQAPIAVAHQRRKAGGQAVTIAWMSGWPAPSVSPTSRARGPATDWMSGTARVGTKRANRAWLRSHQASSHGLVAPPISTTASARQCCAISHAIIPPNDEPPRMKGPRTGSAAAMRAA